MNAFAIQCRSGKDVPPEVSLLWNDLVRPVSSGFRRLSSDGTLNTAVTQVAAKKGGVFALICGFLEKNILSAMAKGLKGSKGQKSADGDGFGGGISRQIGLVRFPLHAEVLWRSGRATKSFH